MSQSRTSKHQQVTETVPATIVEVYANDLSTALGSYTVLYQPTSLPNGWAVRGYTMKDLELSAVLMRALEEKRPVNLTIQRAANRLNPHLVITDAKPI